ncbi:MAG: hypothetical protein NT027_19565 [Proteobacteria bacterium]|nr:hypothetical protein [Pseudomonadota bacterium]
MKKNKFSKIWSAVLFASIAVSMTSCMTQRQEAAVAKNLAFIALSDHIDNTKSVGIRTGQSCYSSDSEPNEIHGPEHLAFEDFLKKLKSEDIRFVVNVKSLHEDKYALLPHMGGPLRCVTFSGEAFK